MIQAIISGLTLALISGATFVAYNHPAAYYAAAKRIGWVLLFVFIGTWLFEFSGTVYLQNLVPHLTIPDAQKVIDDFDRSMQKGVGLVQMAVFGLCIFGAFLSWVAKLKNQKGKE